MHIVRYGSRLLVVQGVLEIDAVRGLRLRAYSEGLHFEVAHKLEQRVVSGQLLGSLLGVKDA